MFLLRFGTTALLSTVAITRSSAKDSRKPSSRPTLPSCATAGSLTQKAVGSQSVQAIVERLYLAWAAFFKGDIKRPPTFCKRLKYRSFTLKQAGYKLLGHGRIKILGRAYRFNQSRAITGLVKTVTVRRDALMDVYLTFSCDQVAQPEQAPKTGKSAGADFGLKTFLTLSSGQRIAAPQPLKTELRRLRKARTSLEP